MNYRLNVVVAEREKSAKVVDNSAYANNSHA